MDKDQIVRIISGLRKKHDHDFSLTLKYRTDTGKIRKRHGRFLELRDDDTLLLFNPDKGATGIYKLARIMEIHKR